MESSRAQWTDARLDDLAGRIEQARIENGCALRTLLMPAFDAKFDRLQQTLIVSMSSVMLAFAAQIIFG